MKAYLKAEKKKKEKDLKGAHNLLLKMGPLDNKNWETNKSVKKVKVAIGDAIKSDNTSKIVSRVGNINNGTSDKIDSIVSLTNRIIAKIKMQIKEIERKIREVERKEERQRAEDRKIEQEKVYKENLKRSKGER